jgi:hypothetical protein
MTTVWCVFDHDEEGSDLLKIFDAPFKALNYRESLSEDDYFRGTIVVQSWDVE